jgi:hypothetical protein
MDTTVTDNNTNVREIDLEALLEELAEVDKGRVSPVKHGNVYNFPIKKTSPLNEFRQFPTQKPKKQFGQLPSAAQKGGKTRKSKKRN